jgi:2',3'-cyclic-nucleotide 2'-phosphodiesterase
MELRILCIGDVVGRPGRQILRDALPVLTAQHKLDCIIVNAENSTDGAGLSAAHYQKVVAAGSHLITLGDHVYRRRDIIPVMETADNIVKPANLPTAAPGKEFAVYRTESGVGIAVISVLGRLFMKLQANCPFAAVDRVMASIPPDVKIIVIDMHAEATSEKIAMGWHVDGRASVIFGTHTHIPTADETVLSNRTAYITDLGMTGPYDSVIGRDRRRVVGTFVSGVPSPFDVATNDVRLCGIIATVESTTGRASAIERIRYDARGSA